MVYHCNHSHLRSFDPYKNLHHTDCNSTVMDVVSCLQCKLRSLSLSLLSHVFPPQFIFFSFLPPPPSFCAIPTSSFLHLNCLLRYIWTTLILFVCSFLYQNSILHCVYPVENVFILKIGHFDYLFIFVQLSPKMVSNNVFHIESEFMANSTEIFTSIIL